MLHKKEKAEEPTRYDTYMPNPKQRERGDKSGEEANLPMKQSKWPRAQQMG